MSDPQIVCQTACDPDLWDVIRGAFFLEPDAFRQIQDPSYGRRIAIAVVLLAGFSQTIGQGIVLFANRVRPIRFILSLLIATILYGFSYGFWVLSTWGVGALLFNRNVLLSSVAKTLALAYIPQVFGFLVALPYLGVPISVLISIWSFLAFISGLKVALEIGTWQAFWCSAIGWAVFQIVQRTIGRPIAALGNWLTNTTAGVQLVTDLRSIEGLVETSLSQSSSRFRSNAPGSNTPDRSSNSDRGK